MSASEIKKMTYQIAKGLFGLNLVPVKDTLNNTQVRFAGIYSQNSVNYILVDLACAFYGITVIPIYDTLGEEATQFAFEQTQMEVCFISYKHLNKILEVRR